jgi:hypothetical protein
MFAQAPFHILTKGGSRAHAGETDIALAGAHADRRGRRRNWLVYFSCARNSPMRRTPSSMFCLVTG